MSAAMRENRVNLIVSMAAMIVFMVLYFIASCFHEPWFDEAQAWQIAKCASFQDILFTIPHYEGHPPLWHLLLALPAKLGVPFELGLKAIGIIVSTTSAYLIVFRSRLPLLVRYVIPFTYFFLYQYGIIVRPYCLMLLLLILLGMELSTNERPWRTAGLLGVLCLTSAYGMLIAGGISLCIAWDLLSEKGIILFIKEVFSDTRERSLLALLCLAVLIAIEIAPADDAYGISFDTTNTLLERLLCSCLILPLECFVTTSSWFSGERIAMQQTSIPMLEMAYMSVVGLGLWFIVCCISSKEKLKYILVPFGLFAVFAANVYFSTHHIGIVFMLFLFWAEMMARDTKKFEIGKHLFANSLQNGRDRKIITIFFKALVGASLVVPIYWCATAIIHDISYQYSGGRVVSSFLRDNNLDEAMILSGWSAMESVEDGSGGHDDYVNTSIIGSAVLLDAYFDRNICYNLNAGRDDMAYVVHRTVSYEESKRVTSQWASKGAPEVIVAHPDLEYVFGDGTDYKDYSLIALYEIGTVWKANVSKAEYPVYLRSDLLDDYGLEALDNERYSYWTEGFSITPEMKERFEAGVPMEEILDPYLDKMFGES